MKTDREIDILIAEELFGFKVTNNCYAAPYAVDFGIGGGGFGGPLLKYSTDIEAAWKVVEKLMKENYRLNWLCQDGYSIDIEYKVSGHPEICLGEVDHESAPMAICLIALKAKGIDLDE